ncbi:MAG: prephenate dehydratase [Spirochaetes bacterium]|nr:prephenate dehydratase [Spirochaetota bacterium]
MKEWRDKIDRIDAEIVRLIGQRAEAAREIAAAKAKDNLPLYQPDREQEVYRKVARLNPGIIDDESLCHVYREIMSATLKLEGSLHLGYFGAEGSHTHQAALKKFGRSLRLTSYRTIDDVFEAVQKKEIKYGIVPIENTTEGMVKATLDAMVKFDLHIYSDIVLQIKQSLLTTATDLARIEKIYTHPQAYAQVRTYLANKLPHAEWVETASTSEAVRLVAAAGNEHFAAVASQVAGELYGLPPLVADITDYERNYTRFIVIGHDIARRATHNRTMISFNLPDSTGSLYRALAPFYEEKINMRGIESRPDRNQVWNYIFFIDLDGHAEDTNVKAAFDKLKNVSSGFRLLGSYPVDGTPDTKT